MEHRHFFYVSQASEMDHNDIWNHPYPDPRLQLENGSFMRTTENVALGGLNSMAYLNIIPRSNDPSSANFSSEIQNSMEVNLGTSHDSYLHAGSSNRIPPSHIQNGPYCYTRRTTGDIGSIVNPQMDYERVPFKRKNPATLMAFHRGSNSGYYNAGSPSNLFISASDSQTNLVSGSQCQPQDSVRMAPNYRSSNLLVPGEGSQRNVRSRYGHPLHLESNPGEAHSSSNLSHQPHLMTDIPILTLAGEWSHTPVSLDSQGSSSNNNSMGIEGGYHPNHVPNRSWATPLPNLHGSSSQPMGVGRRGYDQRITPFRAISSNPPMGFAAAVEDGRAPRMEETLPSRHSRSLSIIARSSERNGRLRNLYGRYQPLSDGENARNRWVSEGVAMIDRSTYYDSRGLLDEHRDLRLDIDNMSYEELLALEESIGNVSTGLSEDTMSRCLVETTHNSFDHMQVDNEEENCVVCLEEYKDGETLGKLTCGHDFHAGCIRKWLLIKNACPICKAAALPDTLKGKQTAPL